MNLRIPSSASLFTRGIVCSFVVTASALAQEPQRPAPSRTQPAVVHPDLPTIFIAGDSTAQNGTSNAVGWGKSFSEFFDSSKINVVNRAVGGTGVRSFMASGYWDRVLAMLKPGDIVMMQFGHNDNGPGGPLPGTGEETEQRQNARNGQSETVHTFGWYLRKYVADARAKGATPIVCSLVPRNTWRDGKIARNKETHAGWAEQAAKAEGVGFVDLNELIAQRYDALGQKAVNPLFADQRVHTTWVEAELSAACVMTGLRSLPKNPAEPFLATGVGSALTK